MSNKTFLATLLGMSLVINAGCGGSQSSEENKAPAVEAAPAAVVVPAPAAPTPAEAAAPAPAESAPAPTAPEQQPAVAQ